MGCGGPGILDMPKAWSLVGLKVSICEQNKSTHKYNWDISEEVTVTLFVNKNLSASKML
jgi:hypothetical protein